MSSKKQVLVVAPDVPKREGYGKSDLVLEDGPVYHQARVSQATGLKDLEADYAFFSHALLFTHGRWRVDPVRDWVANGDPKCCPFAIQLPRPVFKGLEVAGNDSWNHTLMAVPVAQWTGLRSFLASLSGVDRDAKRYHRIAVQELPMADVLALERKAVLPSPIPYTTVTLFALEGSWGTVGFRPRMKLLDRIEVFTQPAEPEVSKLAAAVFAELSKPFQAVEPSVEEAERRAKEQIAAQSKRQEPER